MCDINVYEVLGVDMKKVNKKNHIDLSARLHQIWAMIPLTSGMNARREIKKLIDEIALLHS